MKIDPHTAALTIHGLELAAGSRLEDLRELRPKDLQHPLIANGPFETYRLVDNEAASHLVFKNGRLWQVRTSLLMPEDAKGQLIEASELLRYALHEEELHRLIGTNRLDAVNGSILELCYDKRSMTSWIIITFPVSD